MADGFVESSPMRSRLAEPAGVEAVHHPEAAASSRDRRFSEFDIMAAMRPARRPELGAGPQREIRPLRHVYSTYGRPYSAAVHR